MKKYIRAASIIIITVVLFTSCQSVASTATPYYSELPITSDEAAKKIAFDFILKTDTDIFDDTIEQEGKMYDINVQKTEDYYYIWFNLKEGWLGNLPHIKISTQDGKVSAFWSKLVLKKTGGILRKTEEFVTDSNGEFCTELVDIN